jgi:fucose permease
VKKNFTYYIRTIQAQGIAFVLLLCMLFSPFISSAQLTIKENTIVSFHQDVTSKSSQNSIFSDVQGDNALILSSKAEFLYVGDNVSLYDLIIENSSSFKILSPVQLRGDLEV